MRITINGRVIEVEAGLTVLQAAWQVGVEIPTLCYREDLKPQTSCFLCAVRVEGNGSLQPACALPVSEGMVVDTECDEVAEARKTALELLFSDHAGRCVAPCSMTCPANIEIPQYLMALREGRVREAHAIVRRQIPFPAVLGRICPEFCRHPCERRNVDDAISIRALHRYAAETDMAAADPFQPQRGAPTGKKVAIVGAGPAGLSAAYYLSIEGHDCAVFEDREQPGGLLRYAIPDEQLDKKILDAEIGIIEKLGVSIQTHWRLGRDGTLDDLRSAYDAVILSCGTTLDWQSENRRVDPALVENLGLEYDRKGIVADRQTLETGLKGVFAAGEFMTGARRAVHAVTAGRRAAVSVGQYLRGESVTGLATPFYFQRRQLTEHEEDLLYRTHEKSPCVEDRPEGLTDEEATREAGRCLQCDCPKAMNCKLRAYGAQYRVRPYRFRGERRELDPDASHPEVVYEPGKCILCGMCLRIAEQAGEEKGLSFAGRGFGARVVVPLNGKMSEGMLKAARECALSCPTAAFSIKSNE